MPTPTPRMRVPLPTGRGWGLVGAALAAGLLLFLMLWMGRGDPVASSDGGRDPAAPPQVLRPLPAPPPAGTRAADEVAIEDGAARLDEPDPAPRMAARPDPGPGTPPPLPTTAASATAASAPVPIDSPSPDYPRRALRRGESGEVVLRIHVDARGAPARVEVASSSGSRDLDRAATRAAQRWRFRPAMRDGAPVAGVVNVPISFAARR